MDVVAVVGTLTVPLATALIGAAMGWSISASRARRRLEPRLRQLEARLHEAQARAQEMESRFPALRDEISSGVQEKLQDTLYDFFTDLRASLDLAGDFAGVRSAVKGVREGVGERIEHLGDDLGARLSQLVSGLESLRQNQMDASAASLAADDLSQLVHQIEARMSATIRALRGELSDHTREIVSELQRSHEEIEAARWEITSGLRPLPWEPMDAAEASSGD